jgi:hypothetical protein
MANNFLEQLVAEWYEYRGYFVRRNVPVGRRSNGGFEAELDVVALNPETRHLVHLEPRWMRRSWETGSGASGRSSMPAASTSRALPRVRRAGRDRADRHTRVREQGEPSDAGRRQVLLVSDLMREIMEELSDKKISENAVPEHHSLLRTLQLVVEYRKKVFRDAALTRTKSDKPQMNTVTRSDRLAVNRRTHPCSICVVSVAEIRADEPR